MPEELNIGEIMRDILENDTILDLLEERGWYVNIDIVHEEEFSLLRSPTRTLKVRQWDFPYVFMQHVVYEEKIVYHARSHSAHNSFEYPEIHTPGNWEKGLRELYRAYCR